MTNEKKRKRKKASDAFFQIMKRQYFEDIPVGSAFKEIDKVFVVLLLFLFF